MSQLLAGGSCRIVARAHRAGERGRSMPSSRSTPAGARTAAAASEKRWREGNALRPARRRAAHGEGQPQRARHAHDVGQPPVCGLRPRRRRIARRARTRRWHGDPRQDERAGVHAARLHRQRGVRHDPQSVGPPPHAGRVERRCCRRGCGGHRAAGARHRWRRLDPSPRLAHRARRLQAFAGTRRARRRPAADPARLRSRGRYRADHSRCDAACWKLSPRRIRATPRRRRSQQCRGACRNTSHAAILYVPRFGDAPVDAEIAQSVARACSSYSRSSGIRLPRRPRPSTSMP